MREHRSKDIKKIAKGHIRTFAEEMVLEIETPVARIVFSPTHSPPLICFNSPSPCTMVTVLFGCLIDTLELRIIVDIIKQELMAFTGNFPQKSKNGFHSTHCLFSSTTYIHFPVKRNMLCAQISICIVHAESV